MARKILIVDDYGAMRALVRRIFAHHLPDLDVIESASAEAALVCVERETPQAVIMDTELPGMSGLEATRQIATQHPGCAVIVHAAGDETWWGGSTAEAAGACSVVRKGDCEGLLAATRRLLTM